MTYSVGDEFYASREAQGCIAKEFDEKMPLFPPATP